MTAWEHEMLPSQGNHQRDKQHHNRAFAECMAHWPFPLRHRGHRSNKEIDIHQWLSSTWRIGCKGLAKFTRRQRDFCWTSAAEWVRQEELTDGRQLSWSIDQTCVFQSGGKRTLAKSLHVHTQILQLLMHPYLTFNEYTYSFWYLCNLQWCFLRFHGSHDLEIRWTQSGLQAWWKKQFFVAFANSFLIY